MNDNEKKTIKNNKTVGHLLVLLGVLCSILCLVEAIFASSTIYMVTGFVLFAICILFSLFSFLYTSRQSISYDKEVILIKSWNKEDEIKISDLKAINVNVTNYNGHSILSWYFSTEEENAFQLDMDYDINAEEIKSMIKHIQQNNPAVSLSYSENMFKSATLY